MSNYAPWYYEQIFGNDGKPLSGGYLYFYVTNTVIPKVVYADKANTIPLANPLQLSASGVAPTFFLGSGLYTIRITSSTFEEIATHNDITIDTFNGTALPNPSLGVLEYNGTTLNWNPLYTTQDWVTNYVTSQKNINNGIMGLDSNGKASWTKIDFTGAPNYVENYNETPGMGYFTSLPPASSFSLGFLGIQGNKIWRNNGSSWIELGASNLPANASGFLANDGLGNLSWANSTFKQKYVFTASNQYTNIGSGSDPYGNTVMLSKAVAVNGNPPSNFPVLNYYDNSASGTLDMWFTPVSIDVKYWLLTCVSAAVNQSSLGLNPAIGAVLKIFDSAGTLISNTSFLIGLTNININDNLVASANNSIRLTIDASTGPVNIPAMSYFGIYLVLDRSNNTRINAIKNVMVGIEAEGT